MSAIRGSIWLIVLISLGITWLPYFDILNGSRFVGFLPQPLAVTFAANVVLTLCVVAIYFAYVVPFVRTLSERPVKGGGDE